MLLILMSFFNSSFFIALVTFFVGGFAIFLYKRQKSDAKRDAAKIILQEIRRAEGVITEYKEHHEYKFTKKIIVNNSWAKNISYFVGDLEIDELDKITNLFSTGEYLDSIIQKISDYQFESGVEVFEKAQREIQEKIVQMQAQQTTPVAESVSGGQIRSGQTPLRQSPSIHITMETPWKSILDEITLSYEPIYNSPICQKLKKMAGIQIA